MSSKFVRPGGQLSLIALVSVVMSIEGLAPLERMIGVLIVGGLGFALQWYGDHQPPPPGVIGQARPPADSSESPR